MCTKCAAGPLSNIARLHHAASRHARQHIIRMLAAATAVAEMLAIVHAPPLLHQPLGFAGLCAQVPPPPSICASIAPALLLHCLPTRTPQDCALKCLHDDSPLLGDPAWLAQGWACSLWVYSNYTEMMLGDVLVPGEASVASSCRAWCMVQADVVSTISEPQGAAQKSSRWECCISRALT